MQQNQSYTMTIVSFFLFFISTIIFPTDASAFAQNSSGTVSEAMNSAGYTYMLIDSDAGKIWVAIPETMIAKGAEVTYQPGMLMKNFSSKTLGRTFESIIFSPGLADKNDAQPGDNAADDSFAAAVKSESSKAAVPAPPMAPSGGSLAAVAPLREISVEKSPAANGYTVEEVFAQAKNLDGQKISLRGVVTKLSANIMGRNWVHLQDGTGDPSHNTHDLVATTSEKPELDSEITVEGVVAAEKDFGAGYRYAAIIEQATIVK